MLPNFSIESITADPAAALGFIVDFAQVDLAAARLKDLQRLEHLVEGFINRESPRHEIFGTSLGLAGLRVLQARALGVLSGLAQDGRFAIAGDLVLSFWALRGEDGLTVWVKGTHEHRMLYQLIRVLQTVGAEKLLRCPSKNRGQPCGRLFLKVTQKRFCSTRCQSRALMQQIRDAERREEERVHAETKRTRRRINPQAK